MRGDDGMYYRTSLNWAGVYPLHMFFDDPYPMRPYQSPINREIRSLYGESEIEKELHAWLESAPTHSSTYYPEYHHFDSLRITRGLADVKDRVTPILVWRTLKAAEAGWCVEDFLAACSHGVPRFSIMGMTDYEMHEAVRKRELSLSCSGNDTVVLTYQGRVMRGGNRVARRKRS